MIKLGAIIMISIAAHIGNATKSSDILPIISDDSSELFAIKVRVHPWRRLMEIARVEIHPGVRKSKLVTYPPKYFQGRLKTLLKLKEKREKKEADMNTNRPT